MLCTKHDQALNNLAVIEENKLKIVEAGALPQYVKLLQKTPNDKQQEAEQLAAAHGIWMLAFMHRRRIISEPRCLEGCSHTVCLHP